MVTSLRRERKVDPVTATEQQRKQQRQQQPQHLASRVCMCLRASGEYAGVKKTVDTS